MGGAFLGDLCARVAMMQGFARHNSRRDPDSAAGEKALYLALLQGTHAFVCTRMHATERNSTSHGHC